MGEKKTTLFEINIEEFEFSPSPRFGDELADTVEELEETGSKLDLFGSDEGTDETDEETDAESSDGLFSRDSSEESDADETEESEAEGTEIEVEDEEESEDSGSALALLVGLLFLLVVAAVTKKFVVEGEPEEYEEVELSEYEN